MLNVISYILIGVAVLILIVCLSIATYAESQLIEEYNKTNKSLSSSFTVASKFVAFASATFMNSTVRLSRRKGFLTDVYSPKNKVIFLSDDIYDNSSVAALAVAGHEMGHALQDFQDPELLKRKRKMSLLSKYLGCLMMPSFIVGLFFLIFNSSEIIYSLIFFGLGLLIFGFALFVKLLTISIEKDASIKAIEMLKELNMLEEYELELAKKFLKFALLTYIADFLRSILSWTMLTRKTKIFGG